MVDLYLEAMPYQNIHLESNVPLITMKWRSSKLFSVTFRKLQNRVRCQSTLRLLRLYLQVDITADVTHYTKFWVWESESLLHGKQQPGSVGLQWGKSESRVEYYAWSYWARTLGQPPHPSLKSKIILWIIVSASELKVLWHRTRSKVWATLGHKFFQQICIWTLESLWTFILKVPWASCQAATQAGW